MEELFDIQQQPLGTVNPIGVDFDPNKIDPRAQQSTNPLAANVAIDPILDTPQQNNGLAASVKYDAQLGTIAAEIAQPSSTGIVQAVSQPTVAMIQENLTTSTIQPATVSDNGIYTVDGSGRLVVDFLSDAGDYHNQMAIFSTTGMENLEPGSPEYIKEAARRALSSTTEGYVVIDDRTDAGKFNLEGKDRGGIYQGRKGYNFKAGDTVALMMVPNGTIREIFENPNLEADKRPLFSIDSANPGDFKQLAMGANMLMSWEDLRRDNNADADYNDLVFQIQGAKNNAAADLKTLVAPTSKWYESQVGVDIAKYVETFMFDDKTAPAMTVSLANDTGKSNSDGITSDPTVKLGVKEGGDIAMVSAKFAGTDKSFDVTCCIDRNGNLSIDRPFLEKIYGKTLADGNYTLDFAAMDYSGNRGTSSLTFTVDTAADGMKPKISLASGFDTNDGFSDSATDNRTTKTKVDLTGKADANAKLYITQNPLTGNAPAVAKVIMADADGNYTMSGVDLAFGINGFNVRTEADLAGNTNGTDLDIRRIASDDAVTVWNKQLLKAIATDKTPPPKATRAMAMVETAVFDAVNNITKKYQNYAITETAPAGASAEAAAVIAAHTVLSHLYGSTQQTSLDELRTACLNEIADGKGKEDGIAFGRSIAQKVIDSRANDGSTNTVAYTPGTQPGQWQPTATTTDADGNTVPVPAVLPQWGGVKTFGIPQANVTGDRPAGQPDLTSEEYTKNFNLTKDLGSINSTTRTADQTEIAKFWVDGAGTFTPPGHWNQIAQGVAADRGNSLIENARLFAMMGVVQADAAICCWDAKFTYNFWRPVTAIRNADTDGNVNTIADPNWTPLLTTPNFPEHTSGHSTFSGAGAALLTHLYGDNYSFTTTSPGLVGTTRSFTSFNQARDEAGMSRIYGGIHFMSANTAGKESGGKISDYVVKNLFKDVA